MKIPRSLQRPQISYALVLSAGRTATQWLAAALNKHPAAFVSHGQDLRPRKTADYSAYRQHMEADEHGFDWNDVDGYFDVLERNAGYRFYANVHGIMTYEPFTDPEKYRRTYKTVAMFRNPIIRAESFVRKWSSIRTDECAASFYRDDPELMRYTYTQFNLDPNDKAAALFIHAVKTVMRYDQCYLNQGVPIVISERLTSDIDYFEKTFNYLTAETIATSPAYLNDVKDMSPLDKTAEAASPTDVFTSWPIWRQYHFRQQLIEHYLTDDYEKIGYDLKRTLNKGHQFNSILPRMAAM